MWKPKIDRTGHRYGRLFVLGWGGYRASTKKHLWSCRCDCGSEVVVTAGNLATGLTTSCGCKKLSSGAKNLTTHGLSKTKAHARWKAAKQRCFDPNAHNFKHYGGRGITMDPVWAEDFAAFFSDMGECPDGMTLERIDHSKNYEPGNCRWATQSEQVRNTRRNIIVEHDGERMVLKDYCRRVGVAYNHTLKLMKDGLTAEEATARQLAYRIRYPKIVRGASAYPPTQNQ